MKYKYKNKVGCSIENLKGVRDFIRGSLKNHDIPDLQISEIVLALDEMCSNLMIHAHHCNNATVASPGFMRVLATGWGGG